MATSIPRRFCKPEILKKIDEKYLVEFIQPYLSYLQVRGFDIPTSTNDSEQKIDYDLLSKILLDPNTETPPELSEALFFVNDMSTTEGFDALLEAINKNKLEIEMSSSIALADFAIQVWMKDRKLAERVHAEQLLTKVRSFRYFKNERGIATTIEPITPELIQRIEHSLNDWFVHKGRGRTAKLLYLQKDNCIWFLIRHGEPFTRECVIEDGKSMPLFFQPERTDLFIYNKETGEARINAKSKSQLNLFRENFGYFLFRDRNYFSDVSMFTLTPLITEGRASLTCQEIPEIKEIRLTEVSYSIDDKYDYVITQKATDLFAAIEDSGSKFLQQDGVVLKKATFKIQFTTAKTPRTLTITNGNKALFKRDEDAEVLEKWLGLRGFITFTEYKELAA